MITKIYLVRHTQTIGNVEERLAGRNDYEVTEVGQKYIGLLTNRLKDIKFQNAYSSTSKRTYKTIEPLAKINNLKIIEAEDLCEMDFGIYEGMKWEEVNKINPEIDRLHKETNEIMCIPNQELTEEVANRMYRYIKKISKENLEKTILIASHGVAIEAFLRKITKVPFVEQVKEYSQKNTSINILEYESSKDEFEVKLLNDFSHLENL
jgi:broad specificity phosphatase PhoE